MGSATIVQAIKHMHSLHNRIHHIILIAPQTKDATDIKNFNFDFNLLIIHGDDDKTLSLKCGKTLFNIVSTTKKYMIIIKGADHCMFDTIYSRLLIDVTYDYLNNIFGNKSNIAQLSPGIYEINP